MKTITTARTVSFPKGGLKTEKRVGANGEYDFHSIVFVVAAKRPYARKETLGDGTVRNVYDSDFFLCRANAQLALIIEKNCNIKDATGKIISRHLYLEGHMETYKTGVTLKQDVTFPAPVNATFNVELSSVTESEKVTSVIFVLDRIEFLDANPMKDPNAAATVGATAANVAMPVVTPAAVPFIASTAATAAHIAPPAPVAPVAPQAPFATAPAAQAAMTNFAGGMAMSPEDVSEFEQIINAAGLTGGFTFPNADTSGIEMTVQVPSAAGFENNGTTAPY